ncbi:zincin-like metallopeptidase domain-containing protein [Flammeovirga sp. SJP92]|uniref:zincin-like metallopeptidase domain-containing protein n=1 Tax=Flammeovirga sp. SJP92 TaxID=1775430 RepID=UPI000788AFCB|nr:zincin-like metallopeptidase domain-containing protein [Flammeovirga sp. SJP92]KXX67397.1 hypothetical protein AVL50_26875 [Flammeovirga sp. SJP92]
MFNILIGLIRSKKDSLGRLPVNEQKVFEEELKALKKEYSGVHVIELFNVKGVKVRIKSTDIDRMSRTLSQRATSQDRVIELTRDFLDLIINGKKVYNGSSYNQNSDKATYRHFIHVSKDKFSLVIQFDESVGGALTLNIDPFIKAKQVKTYGFNFADIRMAIANYRINDAIRDVFSNSYLSKIFLKYYSEGYRSKTEYNLARLVKGFKGDFHFDLKKKTFNSIILTTDLLESNEKKFPIEITVGKGNKIKSIEANGVKFTKRSKGFVVASKVFELHLNKQSDDRPNEVKKKDKEITVSKKTTSKVQKDVCGNAISLISESTSLNGCDCLNPHEIKGLGSYVYNVSGVGDGLCGLSGIPQFLQKTYDKVTEILFQRIEKEGLFWRKSWKDSGTGYAYKGKAIMSPINLFTKKSYRGMLNHMSLWGGETPLWLTFKQVQKLKGKIKKGSKASTVYFWAAIDATTKEIIDWDKFRELQAIDKDLAFVSLKFYKVFNYSDTEGIDLKRHSITKIEIKKQIDFKEVELAERIVEGMPKRPLLKHGGTGAFYMPGDDYVNMPHKETFESEHFYYSVLFHELGHSTKHKSRLNTTLKERPSGRTIGGKKGKSYSEEELVAELCASYLCSITGIWFHTLQDNSAAYIKGWMSEYYKTDKDFVSRAIGNAQKAATYIIGDTELETFTDLNELEVLDEKDKKQYESDLKNVESINEKSSISIGWTDQGKEFRVKVDELNYHFHLIKGKVVSFNIADAKLHHDIKMDHIGQLAYAKLACVIKPFLENYNGDDKHQFKKKSKPKTTTKKVTPQPSSDSGREKISKARKMLIDLLPKPKRGKRFTIKEVGVVEKRLHELARFQDPYFKHFYDKSIAIGKKIDEQHTKLMRKQWYPEGGELVYKEKPVSPITNTWYVNKQTLSEPFANIVESITDRIRDIIKYSKKKRSEFYYDELLDELEKDVQEREKVLQMWLDGISDKKLLEIKTPTGFINFLLSDYERFLTSDNGASYYLKLFVTRLFTLRFDHTIEHWYDYQNRDKVTMEKFFKGDIVYKNYIQDRKDSIKQTFDNGVKRNKQGKKEMIEIFEALYKIESKKIQKTVVGLRNAFKKLGFIIAEEYNGSFYIYKESEKTTFENKVHYYFYIDGKYKSPQSEKVLYLKTKMLNYLYTYKGMKDDANHYATINKVEEDHYLKLLDDVREWVDKGAKYEAPKRLNYDTDAVITIKGKKVANARIAFSLNLLNNSNAYLFNKEGVELEYKHSFPSKSYYTHEFELISTSKKVIIDDKEKKIIAVEKMPKSSSEITLLMKPYLNLELSKGRVKVDLTKLEEAKKLKAEGQSKLAKAIFSLLDKVEKLTPEDQSNIKVDDSDKSFNRIINIPINEIHTSRKRFQNRVDSHSSESAERIIKDFYDGKFDWAKFDPITVWKDPIQNKLFVLSGHSRLAAFKEIKSFDTDFFNIPAKVFKGTEKEAIKFALTSNTLSTKETELERANYYRQSLKACELKLAGQNDCIKEVLSELKSAEGKNWKFIWNITQLNPKGFALDQLKLLDKSSEENASIARTIADWVGESRLQHPQLTNQHENEITKWLFEKGYGSKAGQFKAKSKFLKYLHDAIQKNTEFGKFLPDKPLNIAKSISKSEVEIAFDYELQILKDTVNEIEKGIKERSTRYYQAVNEGRITDEQAKDMLSEWYKKLTVAKSKLNNFAGTKNRVMDAAKNQGVLFGLKKNKINWDKLLKQISDEK